MKIIIIIYLLVLCWGCGMKQEKAEVNHQAGFQTIHLTDSARLYKPDAPLSDYLHFRPVDPDLWYPARTQPKDTGMMFRQIIGLLEQRANFYTGSTAGNGLSAQLAGLFCEGFHCSDTLQLLNYRTRSFANSEAASGKFPLVVYFAAYNGMSYENFALFESLAQKGFYVLSVSSIGRYPGDMTMKTADLLEQVTDAVVAIQQLKNNPSIDLTKIGVVGYSWGSLAASIFATTVPGVSCMMSLDGSEFHHYGTSADEDRQFDSTRYSTVFKNLQPEQSYMRLQTAPEKQLKAGDSIFNFITKLPGKSQVVTISHARHEDFTCLAQFVPESGHCKDSSFYRSISKHAISFLTEHLLPAE